MWRTVALSAIVGLLLIEVSTCGAFLLSPFSQQHVVVIYNRLVIWLDEPPLPTAVHFNSVLLIYCL